LKGGDIVSSQHLEEVCFVRVMAYHTDDGKLQFFFDVHPKLEEIMQASELTALSVSGKAVVAIVAAAFMRELTAETGYSSGEGVWTFGGFH
jgi:hypothetical protein